MQERIVILDTSMLMLPGERKINLTSELERILPVKLRVVVPKVVINELERLVKSSPPSIRRKAKLALSLSKQFQLIESLEIVEADEEIIRLAKELKAVVATNDVELRAKLRKQGIIVVSLRGDNKLELFGSID